MEPILSLILNALASEASIKLAQTFYEKVSELKASKANKMTHIREFYSKTPSHDELNEIFTSKIAINLEGTLSMFSPVIPGPPIIKRKLHLEFRRQIEKIRELFDNEDIKETTLDSLVSASSGQMIFRNYNPNLRLVQLGLFQSIVRNSITVFVEYNYFEKKVRPLFRTSQNPCFFEAKITGLVGPYLNSFISEISEIETLKGIFDWTHFDELKKTKAIFVDGTKSKIKFLREPRYLDGDIWIALKKGEKEELVTRFLDLSNNDELKNEKFELNSDCRKLFPEYTVIQQFDNTSKVFETTKIPSL